jgi:4a-hydroxytetrahydrobiopterin dehydratase
MKKLDIEQAEPIRKKFAPDWEIRKGTYLYKKVAFDDYNQTLRFLMAIEKPQIKLDHFADFMNFYNELTIAITTHDVKGLTKLDFELALYIDKALEQMDARQLEENFTENKINFTMPNFDFEWEEANRYEQYRVLGKEEWIKLAKTGKVVVVNNRMANDIENTDAGEEYRDGHWDGLVQAKRDRFTKALSSGQIELPIIARYSDGQLELISGNTRLTGMMRELGQAKAWVYDVPDEVADLEENFADGKKKGKSRPGRVKRAGASCKGSVTDLRKRAKKYSGEKAKMYHWCANMKAGKQK